jgi:signal peptidase I
MAGETVYVKKTSRFERNDLVVFNFYGEDYLTIDDETGKFRKEWQKWLKRLIAYSGDTFYIKNGDIWVNGKHMPDPPLSLSEYDLFSKYEIDDLPEREEWQIRMETKRGDTFHFVAPLTTEQAENYRQRKPAIYDVRKRPAQYDPMDTFLYKPCPTCQWTVDNFGPLRIPVPGDTILVDNSNIKLYQNIPGIQPGKNLIKETLYFVMGDNRHFSMDSRYTGYISHSKMVGIVK